MTRVEALEEAIRIVEKQKMPAAQRKEVLEKLELCISELPFAHWSEEAIFDACDEYIRTTGKEITLRDFDRADLPSHSAIKNRFGITAKTFRNRYYPLKTPRPRSKYEIHPPEHWTKKFIEDYIAIKPKSLQEYNAKRDPGLPGWQTVAKMNGQKTWTGLLDHLELKKVTRSDQHIDYRFVVHYDHNQVRKCMYHTGEQIMQMKNNPQSNLYKHRQKQKM